MPIYALGDRVPQIDPSAFVHPDAVLIGDVRIGPESSVWPMAVLRGDIGAIIVGAQSSIQDGSVIHCTGELDTVIGDRCTIGHGVHLEGCRIEDDSLVGSGSVVLHRVVVGPHALVGAGALVPNGRRVPPHARALGVPARIQEGTVGDDDFEPNVRNYVRNVHRYTEELRRLS